MLLASLPLGVTLVPGCDSKPRAKAVIAARPALSSYPDGAAGLQRLWGDVLRACQKDDREQVHDLLISLMLTKDELGALIGPSAAVERWPGYQFQVSSMANAGAVELVAFVYEKKLDEVSVQRVDELPAAQQGATDKAVLGLMSQPRPLYTVQLRRKPATKGLRYESLVYLNGRWRILAPLGRSS